MEQRMSIEKIDTLVVGVRTTMNSEVRSLQPRGSWWPSARQTRYACPRDGHSASARPGLPERLPALL